MSTSTSKLSPRTALVYGPKHWTTRRMLVPEFFGSDKDLLHTDPVSPGNIRHTREGDAVVQVADARGETTHLSDQEFERISAVTLQTPDITAHDIEAVLAETGIEWQQTEDAWRAAVRISGSLGCQLQAEQHKSGVLIQSSILDWEDRLGELQSDALARFLLIAQGRLRFARFILDHHQVKTASFAQYARLELELPDSVHAVLAAFRLVSAEVTALLNEEVARAYLTSHQMPLPNQDGHPSVRLTI